MPNSIQLFLSNWKRITATMPFFDDMEALEAVRTIFDTDCRFSQEDDLKGNSNSIQNQRSILEKYAKALKKDICS